jgi:hypothetical protein
MAKPPARPLLRQSALHSSTSPSRSHPRRLRCLPRRRSGSESAAPRSSGGSWRTRYAMKGAPRSVRGPTRQPKTHSRLHRSDGSGLCAGGTGLPMGYGDAPGSAVMFTAATVGLAPAVPSIVIAYCRYLPGGLTTRPSAPTAP